MKNLTVNKTTYRVAALLLAVLLVSASVLTACGKKDEPPFSEHIPDAPEAFYVYDEADVLNAEVKAHIISQNDALFALCGAQIVIVAIPTTGDLPIADFAHQLFNKWGIGSAERGNGILALLSIDRDDYWVLQGEGLSDTLPNEVLRAMNNTHLEPYFAKKQYADGTRALVDALVAHFETLYSIDVDTWSGAPGEFTPALPEITTEEENSKPSVALAVLMWVILGVIVVLIVIAILKNIGGGNRGRRKRYNARTAHVRSANYPRVYYPNTRPTGAPRPSGTAHPTGAPRPIGTARPTGAPRPTNATRPASTQPPRQRIQ